MSLNVFAAAVAVTGLSVLTSGAALAQSASSSIQMGQNGPYATFSSSTPLGSQRGFVGPTQNRGFGFSSVDQGSRAAAAPVGPQGQRGQGYGFGAGGGGNAMTSQGNPGVQSRESLTTIGNYYGNVNSTNQQQRWIRPGREFQETNILSENSTDLRPVPSGDWNFGFQNGVRGFGGTIRGLSRGWTLPPTSTGSFDGNIVDP